MYMSRFTRYSDLFAGHGSFDIPANATIGLTFKPRQSLALDFDTQRIWYGSIAAIADPVENIFGCPTAGAGGTDLADCLGGATGAGFGWRNMTIYKFGLNWRVDRAWTVRFGASHGAQPGERGCRALAGRAQSGREQLGRHDPGGGIWAHVRSDLKATEEA
jgi:long-chain fatty acid transport protein